MSSFPGGQWNDGEEPVIGGGQHTREDADRADRWQRIIYALGSKDILKQQCSKRNLSDCWLYHDICLKDNAVETQASIWPLNLIAVKLPVFSSTTGQNSSTHFFDDSNHLTRQHILDQDRLQCSWRTGKQCIACGGNILSDYLGCCSEIKLSVQVKEGHIKTARVLLTESRLPRHSCSNESTYLSPIPGQW